MKRRSTPCTVMDTVAVMDMELALAAETGLY